MLGSTAVSYTHLSIAKVVIIWGVLIACLWAIVWFVLPPRPGTSKPEAEKSALAALSELRAELASYSAAAGSYPSSLETLGPAVQKCGGRVITIEDHQIICGMGAQISHALSQTGVPHRMRSLGIKGEFGQSAWVAEDLYEKHGLTAAKLIEAARIMLKEKK